MTFLVQMLYMEEENIYSSFFICEQIGTMIFLDVTAIVLGKLFFKHKSNKWSNEIQMKLDIIYKTAV